MNQNPHRNPRRSRGAFTLIELLVVIVILAALAALIVPNIGQYGRSTDMAVSAKSQADIASQMQQFFVTQKRYPQGLDSLLDTTGALYSADTTNADTQTRGLPYGGADGTRLQAQLVVGALTNATNAEYLRSLSRSGFDWVYDHDTTAVNSNLSNTTFRGLIADANGTGNAAPSSVNVAEVTGSYLLGKLVPGGLKSGERIVAFGFGQKSTAIGKTTTTCPLYPGADKTYYGRYVAYFKVYASGERATLVGVSDAYGRTPDYTEQQFNESLPDGARQG
ncbi:MAG: type II secretion system GspH family protein [Chthoniobacter sp.]|nr:type II secretion system GspH family protein [Chthoniobacter sp.]